MIFLKLLIILHVPSHRKISSEKRGAADLSSRLASVDLPEPDVPTTATTVSGGILRSTPYSKGRDYVLLDQHSHVVIVL
jgi:hypothetical protein